MSSHVTTTEKTSFDDSEDIFYQFTTSEHQLNKEHFTPVQGVIPDTDMFDPVPHFFYRCVKDYVFPSQHGDTLVTSSDVIMTHEKDEDGETVYYANL